MNIKETLIEVPFDMVAKIFGSYDMHAKKIEKELNVTLVNRDNELKISGQPHSVSLAEEVVHQMIETIKRGIELNDQNVDYAITLAKDAKSKEMSSLHQDYICMTTKGKFIRPKTLGQKKYIDLIRKNMIVISVGPAGTGKTYLAMAHAITAFKNNEVNRIILTRPAIEAGEKLGFLPGDLQSKVDPYLRPLYDALYEIMGAEPFLKNMEKGLIEVAPLAYMRGRTLDNAFIVLDEAQNTTQEQMKMFLTRIGYGSKAIITGDITQKDLPENKKSGLEVAMNILNDIEGIGITRLSNKDVVRHPLVQKIVTAYDRYEKRQGREQHK